MSVKKTLKLVPVKSDEELLDTGSNVQTFHVERENATPQPKILVVTPEITYLPQSIINNVYGTRRPLHTFAVLQD